MWPSDLWPHLSLCPASWLASCAQCAFDRLLAWKTLPIYNHGAHVLTSCSPGSVTPPLWGLLWPPYWKSLLPPNPLPLLPCFIFLHSIYCWGSVYIIHWISWCLKGISIYLINLVKFKEWQCCGKWMEQSNSNQSVVCTPVYPHGSRLAFSFKNNDSNYSLILFYVTTNVEEKIKIILILPVEKWQHTG